MRGMPVTALIKYWYVMAIAALVLALAAAATRLAREEAAHARTRTANAEVLRDLADKTAKAYQAVLADQQAQQARLAELDEKHTKELGDAKREIAGLESDVRAGARRLRFAATCPGTTASVPQATSTSGVDDGARPRLDDAAQSAYFDLRRGIAESRQQIEALQEYVRTACRGG